MQVRIGIDLGGTSVKVGVVDEKYRIIGRGTRNTSSHAGSPERVADAIAGAVGAALAECGLALTQVASIGIGTPGSVNPEEGLVELAANLGFHNVPLGRLVEERIGRAPLLENDANAAAFGEVLAGAARGVKDALMVTLGTGVGGGIIIGGQIYAGFNHHGGEIGHMAIVMDGVPCTCGRNGCFEAYCSATGLIRMTREMMQAHPESAMWALAGGDLERVSGRTAFDGLRRDDPSAKAVVDQYIRYLGFGLGNLVNIFMPEILVVGGGLSHEGETLLEPLREEVKHNTFGYNPNCATQIRAAKLGNDAGIIGAAYLGQLQRKDPVQG